MSKKLKKKAQGYSNAMQAIEYENALDSYYAGKRNDETIAELKDKSASDQWYANEQIRQLKIVSDLDQYDKSQALYETTLDAIDLSARDAEERVRLGLDEQIAEFAFQNEDLERDMWKAAYEAGLQYDLKEQSLESARNTDYIAKENIQLERLAKRHEIEQGLRVNKINKLQTYSEGHKAQFDENLKRIQAEGAIRARGQIGNSVKRAVTANTALSGINQQQLEDNLYYSQEKIASERKLIKVDRRVSLGRQWKKKGGFGQMSIRDARRQGGLLGLKSKESKLKRHETRKEVKRQQEYIAKTLGITEQEFEMSREKLAESLQSAAASAELKLKNILTKEFEAKGQAYAAKMVKPRFGGAQPVPYKTPTTQFVMPQPAPKTPMMNGGAGRAMSRGGGPSGMSVAMGIGSTALAIGAGFATGGTATALMGASGLLGGISSLFS